ncbi:hypothetical protein BJX65DRAFT_313207 [Aspergillus insuetus]
MGSLGPTALHRYRLLLVGTGGNGIGVACELKKNGINDFKIISRHSDFGGVWHANRYPGCYTDVPIMAYQLERKVLNNWRESHASRADMHSYLLDIAKENDLYTHTDFNTEMLEAEWCQDEVGWQITTNNGIYLADFLLTATGYLDEPNIPKIPGMESFQGRVFHSSLWPVDYSGQGDVVAVVGTSSSGAQMIPPVREIASRVIVLQRTATYILPRKDKTFTAEELAEYEKNPEKYTMERNNARTEYDAFWEGLMLAKDPSYGPKAEAEWHEKIDKFGLRPELKKLVTPTMPIGYRRPTMNDEYYRAIAADNVDFVSDGLASVDGNKIKTSGGLEFEVDTIVLATGFKFLGITMDRIKRRDGVIVSKHQKGYARAYKAVTPAGCPNLFLIGGSAPNSMNWDGFLPQMVYPAYVMEMMKYMDTNGIRAMEVTEEAEMEWKQRADKIIKESPMSMDPKSFTVDATGKNRATYPGTRQDMREELSQFDPTAYVVVA